MSSQFGLEDHK